MNHHVLFLEQKDPRDEDNHAIRVASEKGHHMAVQVLLGDVRVDPGKNNYAIVIDIITLSHYC